jgi:hypothetical protein
MVFMHYSCLSTYFIEKFLIFPLSGITNKSDFRSHVKVLVTKNFLISVIIPESVITRVYIIGSFCQIILQNGFKTLHFYQEYMCYHSSLHLSYCLTKSFYKF